MRIRTLVYKTGNNQIIVSLPSYLMEKYGFSGTINFQINKYSFLAKVVHNTILNKNGSTTIKGIVTIPTKIVDNLNLTNKQGIDLIIKEV